MTGFGGGALMTPLLVLVFKLEPLTAVGTALVAALGMKPIGAAIHLRRGTVHREMVLWLAVGAAGYAMLMLVANRWRGSALRMDAIAFCALVLLQPFAQKQSSLVVLVLPALVAGCLPARTRKTRAGWVIATAAVISGMQPLFASGDWQRSFQLAGVDTLIVLLLLAGMALSMRSEALGLKWK